MLRWTRRLTVVALVVLLTVAAQVAPNASAGGTPPEAVVTTRAVTGFAPPVARGLDAGWRVGPVLDPDDAVMVGATLPAALDGGDGHAGGGPALEVRSRRGATWSPWVGLSAAADHGPDAATDEAAGQREGVTDPVWIGPSDALQVRVRDAVDRVELTMVEMRGGDGLGYVAPQAAAPPRHVTSAAASPDRPEIAGRAAWGADESLRNDDPYYADEVRFAVVHHTAGTFPSDPTTVDDEIRAIYAYHTRSRGWDDIAYNFIVDPYGGIWEGRTGGMEKPVVGAHAAGWNLGSTGVVVLGNYQHDRPTQASITALDELLAWKLDHHHVDPEGTTLEVSGSGGTNRHDRGDLVELPTIIGHRDTNLTSCPGDNLYPYIEGTASVDSIHERVARIGTPKMYGGAGPDREQPVAGVPPTWSTSFTGRLDWTLEIHGPDDQVVHRIGGVAAEEMEETWDLRDQTGELVDAGTYVAELTGTNRSGESATPIRTELEITPPAERVGGANRIETAIELSRRTFEDSDLVVIASADAFPDALVATPLAGSLEAPVLLVPSLGIPEEVREEIRRLGAEGAVVVGGTARLGPGVETGLSESGVENITRLAGADRFETAAAVADVVITREHPDEVLVALGDHPDPARAFPDALSAGAFGATLDLPVVLVGSRSPSQPTLDLVQDLAPDDVTIFGGTAAVGEEVAESLATASGGEVSRFAGATRYDTARLAAEELLARLSAAAGDGPPDPHFIRTGLEAMVTTGTNWPDALGAGAVAAERGIPFLLTQGDELPDATRSWLEERAADLAHVLMAGGSAAVSDDVRTAIADIVLSEGPHRESGPDAAAPVDTGPLTDPE